MVVNNVKIFVNMKNKNLFNIGKTLCNKRLFLKLNVYFGQRL